MVHDRDAVAQGVGLLNVMGRQQDRAALAAHLQDRIVQLATGLGVEAGRRLVEEEDLGLVDERQGQREALPLAAGEGVEGTVGFLAQGEAVDELIDVGPGAVEGAEQPQGLARRDLVLQRGGLQRDADPLLDAIGLPQRVHVAQPDRAAVGAAQADDAFDGRGLAGAVRAE